MNTLSKSKLPIQLFLYSFVLISSLLIYGYNFPTWDDYINIVPIIKRLNYELYSQDFTVLESTQFTPRFYYENLIAITTKIGLTIAQAHFFYYVIAFFSFLIGLYTIGKMFGQSKLSAAVLVFLSLKTVGGTIGYVDLFRPGASPAILAMGLSIWGVYFSFRNRWFLAYLMFGLACLIQFLIGAIPAVMFTSLLLLQSFKKKTWLKGLSPLLILFAFAGLVYIPMLLTGTTNTGKISNEEFVYLYGYLRVPHHIIPSAFPIQTWRNFIFFTVASILCIKNSDSLRSEDKTKFFLIIASSLLALLIGYLFVEVYPLSSIAKLQLARTSPFAELMGLIAISCLITEYYKQGVFGLCLLLLITPITKNGSIWLCLVVIIFVLLKTTNRLHLIRNKIITWIALISSLLLLGLYPPASSFREFFYRIYWPVIWFAILALPFVVEEFLGDNRIIKRLIYILGLSSCLFFFLGLFNALPENLAKFWQQRISINRVSQDDITKLALQFRQETNKDATILVPPSLTQFRYYSERSVVFDFRTSTATDQGLKEWSTRMEAILGSVKPPNAEDKVTDLYRQRSSRELVAAAKKFGADYILTRPTWHSDIKGKVIAKKGSWIIYKIN